jgi:SAM-dependent methyltransferase
MIERAPGFGHPPDRSAETIADDRFDAWLGALEARHLANLRFADLTRALRALSSSYVERRRSLARGGALDGAGKRAAFALFYAPIHYLIVRAIVAALPHAHDTARTLVDLGCGTGAGGAAWSRSLDRRPQVIGIDRHPWALAEAARTYRHFGLTFKIHRGDIGVAPLPRSPALILAAFTMNELDDKGRAVLMQRLLDRGKHGDRVLVVEPLARFVSPWWELWRRAFVDAGGRADEWRFRPARPALISKLDRAAGLDHRELTARSLWLPGPG